ncbi:MAG: hypothetical protein KGS45_14095 [Planctomycetes bacterium]|nr:hypothetical protein [Planctomycetota bacterium]
MPTGPINFKAAQAYAANRPAPTSGASTATPPTTIAATPKVTDQVSFSAVAGKITPRAKVGTASPVTQPTAASKTKISSIVAAQVPGKVSFDSASTAATSTPQAPAPKPTLPFYTNPTMKNTAATGIAASRSLDTQA